MTRWASGRAVARVLDLAADLDDLGVLIGNVLEELGLLLLGGLVHAELLHDRVPADLGRSSGASPRICR